MSDKITLNDVSSFQNETTAALTLNDNNDSIVTAFNKTLSRDGTAPNQMGAQLDMNSNRIINLPTPVLASEPLRVADADSIRSGGTITYTETNIPVGGTEGQFLRKTTAGNFDVAWSSTGIIPTAGYAGQSLVKTTNTNYDYAWADQFGYGTIAAAGTMDLGAIPQPVIHVTGTGVIIGSFGNTMVLGQRKLVIFDSTGNLIDPTLSTIVLNTGATNGLPTPLYVPYQAGDMLEVVCVGTSGGNKVYRVTLIMGSGQASTDTSCTGQGKQAATYTDTNVIVKHFSTQIVVSDWSTGSQGGAGSGLIAPGRSQRIINIGNSGASSLSCNILSSNQLGGTDGFTLDPTLNGGLGQPVFFFLVWDGKPNTPGSPSSCNVGIIASNSSASPQNGWTITYPYGCLLMSTMYFTDSAATNRLCYVSKDQRTYSWRFGDAPVLCSGSNSGVFTIVNLGSTFWPLSCGTGAGEIFFQISGSGTGVVKLAVDSVTSSSFPWFVYTGASSAWSFPVRIAPEAASFYYSSTDAGAKVRVISVFDDA